LFALALAGAAAIVGGTRPWGRKLLFPVAIAVYATVAARVESRVGPQGDEPQYLMVAESLLRDHDLDLRRDFEERRYEAFHQGALEPHFRVRGRHGEIYSVHAVGLPLLLLPVYALAGYAGASLFMAVLAALLAREIREVIRTWTGDEGLAEGTAWAVALSPPLVHYAGLVFTEVPAALAVAIGLRRVREPGGARSALAWGVALAFLPWLNVRYALFPAVLLAYFLSRRPRWRVALAAALPSVISAVSIVAYHFVLYGFLDPRRVYGRRPEFSAATLAEGLPGLLLDQEFGLLVYAPLFALAVPGLARLCREAWREGAAALALVLVTLLTAGSWDMWRGGFNPPARFLLPIVPVLAVGVAVALRKGLWPGAALLVGWSLWTGLCGGWRPELVHRDRDVTAPLFRVFSGAEEWTRLLPGYVLAERHRWVLSGVWGAALGLAAFARRRPRVSAAGFATASLGLVAAAGLAGTSAEGPTEGRDAVRLVGRPAFSVPGWTAVSSATARWEPGDLTWGPLYEPQRHPAGAAVGGRLPLAAGRYRLSVDVDPESSVLEPPPRLEILAERREGTGLVRPCSFERTATGIGASFEVLPGERAVTLLLRGGRLLLLRSLALRAGGEG
jgi:hypothetical protein